MSTQSELLRTSKTTPQTDGDDARLLESRVQAEINNQFQGNPYRELRRIACDFSDGLAVLSGEVTSFHLKQLAQTVLQQIDGVKQITNLLTVRSLRPRPR